MYVYMIDCISTPIMAKLAHPRFTQKSLQMLSDNPMISAMVHVEFASNSQFYPCLTGNSRSFIYRRCSTYGISTYIYPRKGPNVGNILYMEHWVCLTEKSWTRYLKGSVDFMLCNGSVGKELWRRLAWLKIGHSGHLRTHWRWGGTWYITAPKGIERQNRQK